MKVNIFAPTYHRLEMTKRCLESVIPQVESSIYDTTLFICDNNSDKEMTDWLTSLASSRVRVFLSDVNVGKAEIINRIYKNNSECDYFISMDSDMIADEEGNFIDSMVWHAHNMPEFGVLSTYQKNNDQHIWKGLTKEHEFEGKKVAHGQFNNIAGGCVILSKQMWDAIGNYKTHGKVYGYDDGLMMAGVHARRKKCGVMMDVKLTHPYDEDDGYREWKANNISKRREVGYYDEES